MSDDIRGVALGGVALGLLQLAHRRMVIALRLENGGEYFGPRGFRLAGTGVSNLNCLDSCSIYKYKQCNGIPSIENWSTGNSLSRICVVRKRSYEVFCGAKDSKGLVTKKCFHWIYHP